MMNIQSTTKTLAEIPCDALVVAVYADGQFDATLSELDMKLNGALSKLMASNELSGKCADITELIAPAGLAADRLLVVGLGERPQMGQGNAYRACGAAAKRLAGKPRKNVAYCMGHDWSLELGRAAVCGALVGCQGQDLYRTKKRLHEPDQITWLGIAEQDLQQAALTAECINHVRQWVNASPGFLTPAWFAEQVEQTVGAHGVEIEIWDEQKLEQQRCGALLAVARASANPARLVVLNYHGGGESQPPVALVGKGVTFDSGGLSLKPSDSMKTMKCDMAGAATVAGTVMAAARLKLPVNIMGVIGLVENMPGGNAYKLGEVLTARSGKTIEVLNTDAEGRLVLADVLDVAVERSPDRIITLATLTGACMVALGTDVTGVMTNDQGWCDQVLEAADRAGEPAWQLPMFSDYGEQINSDVADIKNIGEGRWGGAITAAKFLEHFVADLPWVHLDIAGPAFLEKPKPWLDAGGTGAMLRSLITLLESQ